MTAAGDDVARAVEVLRRGGLVAFPTETVYGLGADASRDEAAVAADLRGEGPARDHPLIVHLAQPGDLTTGRSRRTACAKARGRRVAGAADVSCGRAAAGARRGDGGGRPTVGVRVPDQPLARSPSSKPSVVGWPPPRPTGSAG